MMLAPKSYHDFIIIFIFTNHSLCFTSETLGKLD